MVKDPVQIEKIIQDSFAQPKTVSVLINTRKHFDQLKETINSLLSLARHPENVEIIVRADDDDESTVSRLTELSPDIKVIIGNRNGYENAHLGFWEMTQQSSGEFLMVFSDDFYLSQNWDDYFEMHRGQICVIWTAKELTFATHRSIPLIWERFGIAYSVDVHWKIISLELKAYVRHDELNLVHLHRGAVRDYVEGIEIFMWANKKPIIYEMTDVLKPYIKTDLFTAYKPIIGPCNSWAHPINDYIRGKIYWWPMIEDVNFGYSYIKNAKQWFHPNANLQELWNGDERYVADIIPESEKHPIQLD